MHHLRASAQQIPERYVEKPIFADRQKWHPSVSTDAVLCSKAWRRSPVCNRSARDFGRWHEAGSIRQRLLRLLSRVVSVFPQDAYDCSTMIAARVETALPLFPTLHAVEGDVSFPPAVTTSCPQSPIQPRTSIASERY